MNIKLARSLVLIGGIAMLAVGLLRDETIEVMQKAALVCLECIGIG